MAKSSARRANKQQKEPPAIQLYRFAWKGADQSGRKLTGEMVTRSQQAVSTELQKHNIIVKRVRKKGSLTGRGRVNAKDVMVFSRQMATMIRAGIPMLQALEVVSESLKKPAMVLLIQEMANDVSSGTNFSDALARHPKIFDRFFVNLVEAGEQAGALDQMLDRVATYKEKVESLKARVKKALWYPATVLLVGLGVTALLLIKVVPEFESMFAGFGAELPAMTQTTIELSELAQAYWLHALGSIVAAVVLLRKGMQRSPALTYRVHGFMLRLPILGDILHKSSVSRFTRTVATTFAAGVPLIEGLDTAAGATGNAVYERAVEQVREDVTAGQPLHFAMRMTNQFPALAVQMVSIGEESGALDAMLSRVADYYEEEVDNKVDALTSLMEPLVIVILGVLVGSVIVSMYLPIFQLGTAL
ncbi:type II secretion system F family protein [Halomonas vilamensis]|uniref:Type II secretion system F family protein n=1 Tax=Vreelandella vilamensis TaxID=531309 RepID=A0ABU1H2D8_9GAMM|nr:type II secretion system F family protein [Halomonas vilamensis]MDR5898455.1 type II secretion system F family protein [Halomonas vilamensis]